MSAPMPVTLVDWKPMERNSLKGFASIRLGRSLTIKDVTIHVSNGKAWASLPSKPIIDSSGAAKRNAEGKVHYASILEWVDRESRDRFSEAVVAAVEAAHPGTTGG